MKISTALLALTLGTAAAETAPPDLTLRISQTPVFLKPLAWVGTNAPGQIESSNLWSAIESLKSGGQATGIESFEKFIGQNPKSPWVPVLRNNLGKHYREEGRYSQALKHWEQAWNAVKDDGTLNGRKAGDYALANLSSLLASLGRMPLLKQLIEENESRYFADTSARQLFNATVGGYQDMIKRPEISFRCGTYALFNVAQVLMNTNNASRGLLAIPSPSTGFSMDQLRGFSDQEGLGLVPVERVEGNELIVPSVVHWRENHYAAILEERGDVYLVKDPTFGTSRYLSKAAINAEASGMFMIPKGKITSQWKTLSAADAMSIRGKGRPSLRLYGYNQQCTTCDCPPGSGGSGGNGSNGGRGGGCGFVCSGTSSSYHGLNLGSSGGTTDSGVGMPDWSVSEPYMSLWLTDVPLKYQPSRGDPFQLKIFYRQDDARDVDSSCFSFGSVWESDWLSYLDVTSNPYGYADYQYATVNVYVPGGGNTEYSAVVAAPEVWRYTSFGRVTTNDAMMNPVLQAFYVQSSDGSRRVYEYQHTPLVGNMRVFLSQTVDRFNNTNRFVYTNSSGSILLAQIIDPDGRTNFVRYDSTFTSQIGQVEDPFGRTVSFVYDSNGMLTNVTDTVGISTGFEYGTFGLKRMITPYGSTFFKYDGGEVPGGTANASYERSIEVTIPSGARQLFMYRVDSSYLDANNYIGLYMASSPGTTPDTTPFSNTFETGNFNERNTFHWNARQYAALSTTNLLNLTTNDYNKAHLKHWFIVDHDTVFENLGLEREGSVDDASVGQLTWYDYPDRSSSYPDSEYNGSSFLPSLVAKVLPDGTTQFSHRLYNQLGKLTNEIETFSVNGTLLYRTNVYYYSSDGLDLVEHRGPKNELAAGYGYDAYHNVILMTNALSEVTTNLFDSFGRVISVIRPTGLTTTNIYFPSGAHAGFLDKTIDIEINRTNAFTYANTLVYTHIDERGLSVTNTWDNLQRLTSRRYPDGTYISNIYTRLDLTGERDRLGNWTYSGFNSLQRMVARTNALGKYTTYDYCTCGALDAMTDPLGNTTSYYYDLLGRMTRIVYPDNSVTTNNFNRLGQLVRMGDGTRWITNWYNNQGLLIISSNSFGLVSLNAFDIENRATNQITSTGVSIDQTFDDLGRLLTRTYPDTGVEKFVYSSRGMIAYTNQLTQRTLYVLDAGRRMLFETNANDEVTQFSYSSASDLLSLIDGKNQVTSWQYDQFGRVTNKADNLSAIMFVYRYDANGRLTNRWTPAKGQTYYAYDAIGSLTNVDYPSSPDIRLAYDADNRLTNMVDAVGTTRFGYTAANLLQTEDGPWDADSVGYTYTDRLRTGMTMQQWFAATWTQNYAYDAGYRLTNITSADGHYGYEYRDNPSTLLRKLLFPNGAAITNQYDGLARLTETQLRTSGGALLNSHLYESNVGNQRTNQTRTDGSVVSYTYDKIGQLNVATGKEAGGSARLNEKLGYVYDAAGNLNLRTNNALVQTFNVNSLNQLSNATRTGTLTVAGTSSSQASSVTVNGQGATLYGDFTFAKDGFSLSDGDNTFTALANDSYGRSSTDIVTFFLPATNYFAYDANGNLTTNGTRFFEYDDENELIRITEPSAWKSEFTYDGKMRRRIAREYTWESSNWVQTNEIFYVYDGKRVIQERHLVPQGLGFVPERTITYTRGTDLSGSLQRAGGIGGLLARSEQLTADSSITSAAFYHADGNGNITCIVNMSQAVVARYLYDPFGGVLSKSGSLSDANTMRWSSKELHTQSGLVYYLYRYYEPNLQRWVNRDPLHEVGFISRLGHKLGWHTIAELNLFEIVRNRPSDLLDPVGLTDWGPIGAKCCNNSGNNEWALVNSLWVRLHPGECTGFYDDCDGMTCKGGFYEMGGILGVALVGGGECTDGPDSPCYAQRRWTPKNRGPKAKSPKERGAHDDIPPFSHNYPYYKWDDT